MMLYKITDNSSMCTLSNNRNKGRDTNWYYGWLPTQSNKMFQSGFPHINISLLLVRTFKYFFLKTVWLWYPQFYTRCNRRTGTIKRNNHIWNWFSLFSPQQKLEPSMLFFFFFFISVFLYPASNFFLLVT